MRFEDIGSFESGYDPQTRRICSGLGNHVVIPMDGQGGVVGLEAVECRDMVDSTVRYCASTKISALSLLEKQPALEK